VSVKQRINAEIFGQTYTISGDAEPEYILQLADFVDQKMREVASHAPVASGVKVAVLAALNIADELVRLQRGKEETDRIVRERLERMLGMIDSQLPAASEPFTPETPPPTLLFE
jgi:cell division protein ZapA